MATKLEKLQATQANLVCAKSKYQSLQKRYEELSLKIERLQKEQNAIKLKGTRLKDQILKLDAYLGQQKG